MPRLKKLTRKFRGKYTETLFPALKGLNSLDIKEFKNAILQLILLSMLFILILDYISRTIYYILGLPSTYDSLQFILIAIVFLKIIGEKKHIKYLIGAIPHLLLMYLIAVAIDSNFKYVDLFITNLIFIFLIFLTGTIVRPAYIFLYTFIVFLCFNILRYPDYYDLNPSERTIVFISYFAIGIASYLFSASTEKLINNNRTAREKLISLYQKEESLYLDLSHKLKTPLTILKFNRQYEKDPFFKESIDEMEKATNELKTRSIQNLSTISITEDTVDLYKTLQNSIKEIKPLIKNFEHMNNIVLSLHFDKKNSLKSAVASLSELQIKQAFFNIIEEILDLMPKGANLVLKINLIRESDHYLIIIKSTKQKSKLKTFSSLKKYFRFNLAKNLIKANKGNLKMNTNKNGVLIIEIQLPII